MSVEKEILWKELDRFLNNLRNNGAPLLTKEDIGIYKMLAFEEQQPATAAVLLEQKLRNGPLTGEPAEIAARQFSLIVGRTVSTRHPKSIPAEDISAWATVENESKSSSEPAWF